MILPTSLISDHSKIVMFADDTTIMVKAKSLNEVIMLMNHDLSKIFKWLNINKLKLNIDKTKCMILSNKSITTDRYLTLAHSKIERVEKIKYLGVILNDQLKCDDQIKKCVAAAAFKVNLLKRLSKKLTFDARKTVYSTLVHSKL